MSRGSRSRSASEDYYHYRGRSPGGEDPTNSTVYVGGMSTNTDERSLREFFQKFGTVVETKVCVCVCVRALYVVFCMLQYLQQD